MNTADTKSDAKTADQPDQKTQAQPDLPPASPTDTNLYAAISVLPDSQFDTISMVDVATDTPPKTPDNNRLDTATMTPKVLARAGLHSDIEYGSAGGTRLLLDVNVPEGEGPFATVIMVHGGGWASGDKAEDIMPILEPLTGRFTWFSINYRLAPKYRWPACLEDVQAAIRWVKANAPQYKGDPKRIAIIGYSVGGHLGPLAANLATDGTGVEAVVGFAPNTDLVKDSERRGELSKALQQLMNLPSTLTESTRKILTEASPITHIKPGQPPVLMLCGDADQTVPIVMCQDYLAELQKNNVPGELYTVNKGTHSIGAWAPTFKPKLVDWLQKTLRSQ